MNKQIINEKYILHVVIKLFMVWQKLSNVDCIGGNIDLILINQTAEL